MLYDIRKPLDVTIDGEHHDTLRQDYPGCFSYFANYYGSVRWTDATTPRTARPVRFVWLSDRVYPSATPGVPSWRSYKPRVARGYMQSVRPVRFPA